MTDRDWCNAQADAAELNDAFDLANASGAVTRSTIAMLIHKLQEARSAPPVRATTREHIYIAGPMTGLPNFNYPAFAEAAARGRALGLTILNPAENFDGDQTREYDEYIRAALDMVLRSQKIALLAGWERSKGARLELHLAQILGLTVLDAATFAPLDVPNVLTAVSPPPRERSAPIREDKA